MNRLRETLQQLARADATDPSEFAPIDLEPGIDPERIPNLFGRFRSGGQTIRPRR